MSDAWLSSNLRVSLDLGRVEVIAEVKLNGKELGTLWKPPYCLEINDAVRAGENTLEVKVTNLWVNRQIGDEQLPEDSQRNADGTLKAWPEWLRKANPARPVDTASPPGGFGKKTRRCWTPVCLARSR